MAQDVVAARSRSFVKKFFTSQHTANDVKILNSGA
mgnify:CR=1 FL=1